MATKTRKPGKTRIMVQVWGRLATRITEEFKTLHLKRDSYLNSLFSLELQKLANEVDFRNPDEFSDRLISRTLPDRVKWTIELDEEVEARMTQVLEERNIPRDSFVNRVLFLLVAKKPALDYLGFHVETTADIEARPLTDVAGFLHDPFFHLRSANREIYKGINFPDGPFGKGGPNLFAMNTAVTEQDWEIFTTPFDDDALLLDMGIRVNKEVTNAAD